jgi:hypothetical protein
MQSETLPPAARLLGLSGLIPPAWATLTVFANAELKWGAMAIAYAYAAIIFSFLGGVWWGLALRADKPAPWLYGVAVLPSLISVATFLPWIWGYVWPAPSMIVLGMCIMASPIIDHRIGQMMSLPQGWLKLRWTLSLGLGAMTLLLGVTQS